MRFGDGDGPSLFDVETERSDLGLTISWRTSGAVSARVEIENGGSHPGRPLGGSGWVFRVEVPEWERVVWRVVISGFPGAPISTRWQTSEPPSD